MPSMRYMVLARGELTYLMASMFVALSKYTLQKIDIDAYDFSRGSLRMKWFRNMGQSKEDYCLVANSVRNRRNTYKNCGIIARDMHEVSGWRYY